MSEIGIYLRAGERNALSSVHSRLEVWAVHQDGGQTSDMAFGDKSVIMGIRGYPGFASAAPPSQVWGPFHFQHSLAMSKGGYGITPHPP